MIANPGDYAGQRAAECAKCKQLRPVSEMVRAPRASHYCGKMVCATCIDAPAVMRYNPVRETKHDVG